MIYNTEHDSHTLEDILSKVTEYDIYAHYLGKFKVGHIYNSPFRKDNNPSFGIFIGKNGSLLFKDHGSNVSGGIIKFVSLLKGLSDYNEILNTISTDLNISSVSTSITNKKYYRSKNTKIGVVRQPFTEIDIEYWKQFGIQLDTLKKFDVFSIKYYLCNGIVKGIYKEDNPMYAFKVYSKFKIYRPLANKYVKWRNNLTEKHIQGWKQLPENGDILIITKSLKDVMCLYEMGIPAISPSSESTFIPDIALERILKRFKRVLILFDRDVPGAKSSRLYGLKTGLKSFFVHRKFKAKDVSDAIKNNSFKEVEEWIKKTLKIS